MAMQPSMGLAFTKWHERYLFAVPIERIYPMATTGVRLNTVFRVKCHKNIPVLGRDQRFLAGVPTLGVTRSDTSATLGRVSGRNV